MNSHTTRQDTTERSERFYRAWKERMNAMVNGEYIPPHGHHQIVPVRGYFRRLPNGGTRKNKALAMAYARAERALAGLIAYAEGRHVRQASASRASGSR